MSHTGSDKSILVYTGERVVDGEEKSLHLCNIHGLQEGQPSQYSLDAPSDRVQVPAQKWFLIPIF